MSARSPVANLTEYFTLKGAIAASDGVAAPARAAIAAAFALGRQRLDCAEILWTNGHNAEAIALARDAYRATLEGVRLLRGAPADAPSMDDFGAFEPALTPHLDRGALDDARELFRLSQGPLPAADRDVSPAHAELFVSLVRAQKELERAFGGAARTRRDLQFSRALRITLVVLVVLGAIALLAKVLQGPSQLSASASAFFQRSPHFAPESAIDGSASTSWFLPDGATGWLEVATTPPRHVDHIRLLNSVNPPWDDRATHDYRLEVFAHGALARTIDGSFDWSDAPSFVEEDVGVDDVERVRFVVRSFHRNGAGLAELRFD